MLDRIRILGIPIDVVTHTEALARCREAVERGTFLHVVTANPEIVLQASRSSTDRAIFEKAELVVPDGRGLLWAARRKGQHIPERITGIDLLIELSRSGERLFLVGGHQGVAQQAATKLQEAFPGGSVTAFTADHVATQIPPEFWEAIERVRPAILAVGYGAPTQERWIVQYHERLAAAGIRVALGVGGAFDTLSGCLPRAPRWMQQAGLEWLWRLLLEPQRLPRILRATVVFPLAVLKEKKFNVGLSS